VDELGVGKVAIVGAGSWGTTLGGLAADGATSPTTIWAREPEVVEGIQRDHENPLFMTGHRLPPTLHATGSLEEALGDAGVVVMAVPSQHFRTVFRRVAPLLPEDATVVSVVKGIEQGSLLRMTEVMAEESDHDPALVGVLSGPNIAPEVAAGQPAATVIALADRRRAEALQARFMGPRFRVYTNDDVIGCEISGAVKNVIAIAAGIADGLGLGLNTKAALLTRGLAELCRLGTAMGGRPLTFLGLAGNGDLIATCGSERSRNHRVGVELGKGRSIDEISGEMHMVAEGIETTPGVLGLAARAGVEMPIAQEVSEVISGHRSPEEAVDVLMGRAPRSETDDLPTSP
jgi:glycerol-3-phosphate dehydrogenase (NAD(P)+)